MVNPQHANLATMRKEELAGAETAHRLGMTATQFRNASGLPDPGQMTTARDMLTLAMRLNDDFPNHYKLFALRSFSYGGRTYANHNTMMNSYAGMDGLKTGYTRRAGFCLVGTTEKCGHRLISIVLGCRGPQIRNEVVRQMFCSYYTSIGLDPIGEYCPAPPQESAIVDIPCSRGVSRDRCRGRRRDRLPGRCHRARGRCQS